MLDRPRVMTIRRYGDEELEIDGRKVAKPAIVFQESPKPLLLSKTVARQLAELFGPDTDGWTGKRVEAYAELVKAFGREVQSVRVREAPPQKATKPPAGESGGEKDHGR